MNPDIHTSLQGLREGGVYLTPNGTTVVVCSEDDGTSVLYVLEETEAESGGGRRKFELFKADQKGRLFRYGRPTDWRVRDLDLADTGETVRLC
jgi:hypothetical protein